MIHNATNIRLRYEVLETRSTVDTQKKHSSARNTSVSTGWYSVLDCRSCIKVAAGSQAYESTTIALCQDLDTPDMLMFEVHEVDLLPEPIQRLIQYRTTGNSGCAVHNSLFACSMPTISGQIPDNYKLRYGIAEHTDQQLRAAQHTVTAINSSSSPASGLIRDQKVSRQVPPFQTLANPASAINQVEYAESGRPASLKIPLVAFMTLSTEKAAASTVTYRADSVPLVPIQPDQAAGHLNIQKYAEQQLSQADREHVAIQAGSPDFARKNEFQCLDLLVKHTPELNQQYGATQCLPLCNDPKTLLRTIDKLMCADSLPTDVSLTLSYTGTKDPNKNGASTVSMQRPGELHKASVAMHQARLKYGHRPHCPEQSSPHQDLSSGKHPLYAHLMSIINVLTRLASTYVSEAFIHGAQCNSHAIS